MIFGRIFKRVAAAALCLTAAGPAAAATFLSDSISFRDITGTVEIVTTAADEIDIEIRQGTDYSQVTLLEEDGVVIVKGAPWREAEPRNCCDTRLTRQENLRKGRTATTVEPVDEAFFAAQPTIVVAMPFEGDVEFIDARIRLTMERIAGGLSIDGCYVYGEIGDVGFAEIGLISGSRVIMGNVGAALELDLSGDADLRAGDAAMVDIDIAGPGDAILGDVDGMMDVSIAGSGLVRAERLDGPLTARIAGSGAVFVKDGRADRLRARVDGSGGVFFGGAAHQPALRLHGSAEVRMGSVTGRITRYGTGAVFVAGEKVAK